MGLDNTNWIAGLGMSAAGTLEFIEESDQYFSATDISDELAIALCEGERFEVDWPNPSNGHRFRVRPKGWVGQFLVCGKTIIVQPKVPVHNIFGMLEFAYDLKAFNLFEGDVRVQSLQDIFDRISSIFANRV